MGRMYVASKQTTAQTAAQDVFELVAAADNPVTIHEVEITSNLTTDERNHIMLHRGTATGSGGTAGTEEALGGLTANVPAADSATEFNNTTQSADGDVIRRTEWSCLVPYHYLPTPETRPKIPEGQLFIVSLEETITSTTLTCTVIWEEDA